MAKGISVHVGINQPDPSFDVNPLFGCENDAVEMSKIAAANGFEVIPPLLGDQAKFENVEAAILDAASRLVTGDIFLFTFAGHGDVSSTTFSPEEQDSQDEAILLYDCILIDNYLRRKLWSEFKKDVRILGIADSCHSGTVLTSIPPDDAADPIPMLTGSGAVAAVSVAQATVPRRDPALTDPPLVAQRVPAIGKCDRAYSEADRERILEKMNPELLEKLKGKPEPTPPLEAILLTLAACSDFQLARDGAEHGVFTQALIDVWDNGGFNGPDANYRNFIKQIRDKVVPISPQQIPILRPISVDPNFVKQRPFTIG